MRVMRAADDIAVKLTPQQLGVTTQHAARHRAANIRIDFVAIQAEQLQPASVQKETVEFKPCLSKPDPHTVIVHRLAFDEERRDNVVKVGRIDIPQRDLPQIRQRQCDRLPAWFIEGQCFLRPGDDPAAIAQCNLDAQRCGCRDARIQGTEDLYSPVSRQHVDRLGKDVADEDWRNDFNARRAVDAASFEIVNALGPVF